MRPEGGGTSFPVQKANLKVCSQLSRSKDRPVDIIRSVRRRNHDSLTVLVSELREKFAGNLPVLSMRTLP